MRTIFAPGRTPILIGMLLVAIFIGVFYYSNTNNKIDVGLDYPYKLPDGSVVSNVIYGDKAVSMVKNLHWSPEKLVITNAVVLEYTDGSRIWITVSNMSNQLLKNMVSKIMEYEGSLPFKIIHNITVSGINAILMSDLNDAGKIHVVWVKNDLLVWAEIRMSNLDLLSKTISLLINNINLSS